MTKEAQFKALLGAFEVHDVDAIAVSFNSGIDPNDRFDDGHQDKPLIQYMISMYMRSPRFSDCIRQFFRYGLHWEDDFLKAILLNDTASLEFQIMNDPDIVYNTYNLDNAYTAMKNVSALHICAEFNHVSCARILVNSGLDINFVAGVDEHGFGGQTPIFHTVNQNGNASKEMLHFLIGNGADPTLTVKGLHWGQNYPWETLYPAVNPISFAMMGLTPQMHRDPETTKEVVQMLVKKAFGIEYGFPNVPCAYLQ
ncbi:MAG: ankyrin repeat domain-containing protein, partial [Bacteroidia bacterium]|nr:ankyrin repeat domain-containing protein [Bacteroidia bacterium]